MTIIYFRNLGSEQVKTMSVPVDRAEAAIDMIRRSDTLEYCAAYPADGCPPEC